MSGRSHEAGAIHGDFGYRGPAWLRTPVDVNALLKPLWPLTVHKGPDGVLEVGGIKATALKEEFGTPAYIFDEEDFRSRCRAFKAAFKNADVFYAGKAFLCKAIVRILIEEDLSLDVCSGGELATALSAGMDPKRIGFHGNNKSMSELERAVQSGVGRIIVDSFDEIDRLTSFRQPVSVMIRVTVGVEAHTHEFIATAHEDQKFGFGLADGTAVRAAQKILSEGVLNLRGFHSHIGSQIFDASGFEISARRVLSLQKRVRDELATELPELDLGGGFGIAYTSQDDPSPADDLARRMFKIVDDECDALGLAHPHLSVEPGRAIAGPSTFTLYEVGTVKPLDGIRTYVSVDGGMSDNIRTALYDASYSATIASRNSDAEPMLARVVGKHCESGDVVVKDEFLPADTKTGDLLAVPGTGAYCRSMASNYNHVPRPPVIAVRDGQARVIVRRETEEDLLALDVG
jgi:diaminopimelate decarboxylase